MSKNMIRDRNAILGVHGPVPAGSLNGDVVLLGSGGLRGYMITERVTTALLADMTRTLPHDLKDGEATVQLPGISLSVKLQVGSAVDIWAPIYKVTADGTYSVSSTGATKIGYALEAQAAAGKVEVGLLPNS